MTEERDQIILEEKRKKAFHPRLLDYQRFRSQRLFEILFIVVLALFLGLFLIFYPNDPHTGNMILFSLIFVGTFLLVAKYHHLQLTIILVACSVSLLLALLLLEDFRWLHVIDEYMEWEVLAVVFGMSILVAATSETGLFDWLIIRMLKISRGNIFPLFALTFILTFSLSTVLANVTAMILVGSMILTVCNGLDYDPTPFLLSAVLATSLAGVATLVSSLPAIMVGATDAGNIGFIDFILVSIPFLIITIPITIIYLKWAFPAEKIPLGEVSKNGIDTQMILSLDEWGVVEDRRRFYLAAISLIITIVGFILSQPLNFPIGVIAILGGILAIVLTRSDEHRLIRELSWDTLLFFAGLFILVGVLEDTHVLENIANSLKELSGGDLFFAGFLILLIASIFSGILDNIPVTAALIPIVSDINEPYVTNNPRFLWFILVFAGAFGGGLTPFGSAASILAISLLAKEGRPLNFKYFMFRLVPISLILLVFSGIYLSFLAFVVGVI